MKCETDKPVHMTNPSKAIPMSNSDSGKTSLAAKQSSRSHPPVGVHVYDIHGREVPREDLEAE